MLVGNTVRPFTDKLKISRAKLAYIVDSTAAPVASIAVISTWVGFEIGLIRDAVRTLPITEDAYILFLRSIPYSSYSIFAIVLVAAIAWWGRDFGPMRKIERDALQGHDPSVQDRKGVDTMISAEAVWVGLLTVKVRDADWVVWLAVSTATA